MQAPKKPAGAKTGAAAAKSKKGKQKKEIEEPFNFDAMFMKAVFSWRSSQANADKNGGEETEEEAKGKKTETGVVDEKESTSGKKTGSVDKKTGATAKKSVAVSSRKSVTTGKTTATVSKKTTTTGKKIGAVAQKTGVVSKTKKATGPSRPSSDLASFRQEFSKAKHIVVLTGAGVSAESGVPTFRGAGGYWRKWQAQDLASPEAFKDNPSLVWEFYHHRREVMATKKPNPAHRAIAETEKRLAAQGRKVVVITQNIDELHKAAGSQDILELHGSLFRVRCTKCGEVTVNRDSPICPALGGKGEPNPQAKDAKIPVDQLPTCQKDECNGLLRPDVIWFGESLNREVLDRAFNEMATCDLCLVVGTSSIVYPAAMFAPSAAQRGVTVAEFNIEATPATDQFGYMFEGPAGKWLPKALAAHPNEGK